MITKRTKNKFSKAACEILEIYDFYGRRAMQLEYSEGEIWMGPSYGVELSTSDAKTLYKWLRRRVREMEGKG